MEPVVWKALPGAAGVVVWSGSDQLGTSVLHLLNLVIIMFIVHLLVDNVDQQCTNPYHFNCHCQKIDILITTAEARLCPKSFDRVDLVPGNIFLESNYQPN